MKLDRKNEIMAKSFDDLLLERNSLKRILMNLRFKKTKKELQKTHVLSAVKKEIAFVLMLIGQKEELKS